MNIFRLFWLVLWCWLFSLLQFAPYSNFQLFQKALRKNDWLNDWWLKNHLPYRQELWGIIMVHQNWKLGFIQIVMFSSFLLAKLYASLNQRHELLKCISKNPCGFLSLNKKAGKGWESWEPVLNNSVKLRNVGLVMKVKGSQEEE